MRTTRASPAFRRLAAALAALALLAVGRPASAHTVNLSQSDLTLEGDTVRGLIVFAKLDAMRLGRMDPNGDGVVTEGELAASQSTFRERVDRGFEVEADGERCAPTLEGGGDVGGDGFGLSVTFACGHRPRELSIAMPLLGELPLAHRQLLRLVVGDATHETVLSRGNPRAEWNVSGSGTTDGPPLLAAVKLGVEHILTGWDHLLFLLALLLGTKGNKAVVLAVSAFTLAHSLTLAAAALGFVTLPARVVEPAIALSIAFVAFENVVRGPVDSRWRETLVFGLVHGLGFASALSDLSLSTDRLLPVLLGFNAGVEVGQLLVVIPLVPLLRFAARRGGPRALRVASIVVGVVGAVLFVQRLAATGAGVSGPLPL